ncbi:MAG: hypothetical protein ACOH2T_29300 [Pseudomonas sp.]
MSSIKRWFAHWYMQEMFESATGDYIQVVDYDAALAREATLQQRLTTADQRIDDLEAQLRKGLMVIARTLEAGRDRIIGYGGDCDSVEYMMDGDPSVIEIRAALKKP